MRKTTFIKSVDDISVGHLYEHLFCDYVIKLLRQKALFAYVDYYLEAKTFHTGTVVITMETYTEKATAQLSNISDIRLSLDADDINGALLQIMAELCSDIVAIDDTAVSSKLSVYNQQAWKIVPDAPEKYQKTASRSTAITYEPIAKRHFGTIIQTISVKRSKVPDELLPLFLVVSKAIRGNLQEDISSHSFCYTYKDLFKLGRQLLQDINYYRIDKRQAIRIDDELGVSDELMKTIASHGFAQRLSRSLQKTSPSSLDYPSSEEIYAKLNTHVTPETWKSTATEENITKLLNEVIISFTYKQYETTTQS